MNVSSNIYTRNFFLLWWLDGFNILVYFKKNLCACCKEPFNYLTSFWDLFAIDVVTIISQITYKCLTHILDKVLSNMPIYHYQQHSKNYEQLNKFIKKTAKNEQLITSIYFSNNSIILYISKFNCFSRNSFFITFIKNVCKWGMKKNSPPPPFHGLNKIQPLLGPKLIPPT